jgi:hypothetical protein
MREEILSAQYESANAQKTLAEEVSRIREELKVKETESQQEVERIRVEMVKNKNKNKN